MTHKNCYLRLSPADENAMGTYYFFKVNIFNIFKAVNMFFLKHVRIESLCHMLLHSYCDFNMIVPPNLLDFCDMIHTWGDMR